ncbi:hypothetical protein BH24ACT6_BH24ACT6_17010 [soil metagenome]
MHVLVVVLDGLVTMTVFVIAATKRTAAIAHRITPRDLIAARFGSSHSIASSQSGGTSRAGD